VVYVTEPIDIVDMINQLLNPSAPTYGLRAFAHAILDVFEAMPDEHIPDTSMAMFVMELALGIISSAIPIDEATGKVCFQDFLIFRRAFYEDAHAKTTNADDS
jgi:hypothetical protein